MDFGINKINNKFLLPPIPKPDDLSVSNLIKNNNLTNTDLIKTNNLIKQRFNL